MKFQEEFRRQNRLVTIERDISGGKERWYLTHTYSMTTNGCWPRQGHYFEGPLTDKEYASIREWLVKAGSAMFADKVIEKVKRLAQKPIPAEGSK